MSELVALIPGLIRKTREGAIFWSEDSLSVDSEGDYVAKIEGITVNVWIFNQRNNTHYALRLLNEKGVLVDVVNSEDDPQYKDEIKDLHETVRRQVNNVEGVYSKLKDWLS